MSASFEVAKQWVVCKDGKMSSAWIPSTCEHEGEEYFRVAKWDKSLCKFIHGKIFQFNYGDQEDTPTLNCKFIENAQTARHEALLASVTSHVIGELMFCYGE